VYFGGEGHFQLGAAGLQVADADAERVHDALPVEAGRHFRAEILVPRLKSIGHRTASFTR
jgi:hypothetical protein